jgi:hypothetical protein
MPVGIGEDVAAFFKKSGAKIFAALRPGGVVITTPRARVMKNFFASFFQKKAAPAR